MSAENLYTPEHIRTFTGKYVNVFDPKPEMFCIEDIAHSLSMQCRFGGHLPVFYSVAEHSYRCSKEFFAVDLKAFDALMHDCSEAYLMDIPSPIKDKFPDYKTIENNLMIVLSNHFGFRYPLPISVHEVDKEILEIEWLTLMLKQPHKVRKPMSQKIAERVFLERYNYLKP